MKLSQILLGMTLAASIALPSQAQVVYNNGGPDGQNGLAIIAPFTSADNFSFGSTTSFDAVRFWNVNFGSGLTAGYNWYIYTDAAGAPGGLVSSGFAAAVQTAQGAGCCGTNRYQNDMNIGTQSLGAGTYWLALHDVSGAAGYWETSAASGNAHYDDGSGFASYPAELSFELSTTVTATPEPASLVLLGTGLVGVFGFARRRLRAR